jgi:mono/diheme cytochrome c family protein
MIWTSTRALAVLWLCAGATAFAACSDHDFEPPDPALRVERAAAGYAPELFDTVQWADEATRRTEGNAVYAAECRRCHGVIGRGDTDYARSRGLTAPSLVEPDWPMADMDSVRRAVYVGHEAGMPSFGERNLGPREIDAAAAYVLNTLRPEVLGRH